MLASIFFLSFFFLIGICQAWRASSMCESENQFEFLFPQPALSPCWSTSKQRSKRKLHHIFPRRWVNWLVHLNESCMQWLHCLFYHSSQRVAHVDAVTGFHFEMFLCLAAWLLQMQSVCGQVQNNISLVLWKDVMHCIKKYFLNYKLFKMLNLAKKRYFALGLKICLGCLNVASLNLILICWNLFLRGSDVEKCWHN